MNATKRRLLLREKNYSLPALDAVLLKQDGIFCTIGKEGDGCDADGDDMVQRKTRNMLWRYILQANRRLKRQRKESNINEALGGHNGYDTTEAKIERVSSCCKPETSQISNSKKYETDLGRATPLMLDSNFEELFENESCRTTFRKRNSLLSQIKSVDAEKLRGLAYSPLSCHVVQEEQWSSSTNGSERAEASSAVKLVIQLSDGNRVETVVLKHKPPTQKKNRDIDESSDRSGMQCNNSNLNYRGNRVGSVRATVCVSSQVGCRMKVSLLLSLFLTP